MKALVAALLLCLPLTGCLLAGDKRLHLMISIPFGAAAAHTVHRAYPQSRPLTQIFWGTVIGSLPGLAKECSWDGFYEKDDMAANVSGALIGSWLYTLGAQ